MPMLFCFYGKIEHGGYFIGALGLLFGVIFMLESIYVVSGSQTEDLQFMSFSKFKIVLNDIFFKFFSSFLSFAHRCDYSDCATDLSSLWNI